MTSAAQTELLTAIVAATRDRLAAAACSVAFLDGAELEFRVASGVGEREVVGLRMPADRGIAGWVVASGQTVAIADAHSDARFDRDTAQQTGFLPTSILATPIEGDDGPIGVLEVLDRTSGPEDFQVVGAAARQIALVLRLVAAAADAEGVLADPGLAEHLALLSQLRGLDVADRRLAARLLAAVVERAR